MPSSVSISGLRIYKPGIYAIIDASALGGKGVSTGNVAVVGSFPSMEKATPWTFTSARAVKDFHDDSELATIAKLAFSPSTDRRVPGGASTLTYVSVDTTTQGSTTFQDNQASDSIVLKSKLWGSIGNRVFVKLDTNSLDLNGLDVTISRDGTTESFVDLQSGPVADFWYDGGELTTSVLSVDPTELEWSWSKALTFTAPGGAQSLAYNPVAFLSGDSAIGFTMTDGLGAASQAAVTLTIVGVSKANIATTEVFTAAQGGLSFVDANNQAAIATATEWGSVTSITIATADAAYIGVVTLTGLAFSIDTTTMPSLGAICSFINNNANKGFNASALHPRINKIPASASATGSKSGGWDSLQNQDVNGLGLKKTTTASLWHIAETLNNNSTLVSCEAASSASLPPKHVGANPATTEQTFMVGGSVIVGTGTDWDDALLAIEAADIQIVVPISSAIANHKKIITHCVDSALAGYERNGWCGATSSQTLANLFTTFTSQLNSRHVALVGQKIQVTGPDGESTWLDPEYMAVMCAGMQAGTPVATPLTWKRPDVLDVYQSWNPVLDDGEAISKGICVLSRDNLGWKVERSVTTHLEDDNPIYSEVSANESVNTSVRSLRASLIGHIGNPVLGATANQLAGIVVGALDKQTKDGVIKAWQNVVLEDLGDTIRVTYEVAAVEPLNFIIIVANVVRIPST